MTWYMDYWLFSDFTGPLSHGGNPECPLFWLEGPASWSTGQVSSVFNFVVCGFMLIYHLYHSSIFQCMHHPCAILFHTALLFLHNKIALSTNLVSAHRRLNWGVFYQEVCWIMASFQNVLQKAKGMISARVEFATIVGVVSARCPLT